MRVESNSTFTHDSFETCTVELHEEDTTKQLAKCICSAAQNSITNSTQHAYEHMSTPVPAVRNCNMFQSPLMKLEKAYYEERRASFSATIYPQNDLELLKFDLK